MSDESAAGSAATDEAAAAASGDEALIGPVTGPKRNGALVAAQLEELCQRLRRYKVIHVIWDSPKIFYLDSL